MLISTANPGTSAYVGTYNGPTFNLSTAANGQTWTGSLWVKGSSAFTASMLIFEANSSGGYTTYGQGYFNVTTSWTIVSVSYTMTQSTTAYVQARFDCYNTSVSFWVDGFQMERNSAATNFSPFPNSGAVWLDNSGLGNNATMYSYPVVSTDGGGCFDFSGATGAASYASTQGFTFANNMIPTTGSYTFACWVKNPPSSVGQCGMFSNAGGGDGYRYGVGLNGIYYLVGPTYTEAVITFTSSLSSSSWYHVVTVFDRAGTNNGGTPQMQVYVNGVFQNTGSMPSSQTTSQNAAPGLVRSPCCGIYTGKLATFSAYSRALSSTEIAQLFNATRKRFGV